MFFLFLLLSLAIAQGGTGGDLVLTDASRPRMELFFILGIVVMTSGAIVQAPGLALVGLGVLLVGVFADETVCFDGVCFSFDTGVHTGERDLNAIEKQISAVLKYFPRSDSEILKDARDKIEQTIELDHVNVDSLVNTIYWDNWMTDRPMRVRHDIQKQIKWCSDAEIYYLIKDLWIVYDFETFNYLISNISLSDRISMTKQNIGSYRAGKNLFACIFKNKCSLTYKWKYNWTSHIIWILLSMLGLILLICPPSSISRKQSRPVGIIISVISTAALAVCAI